MEVGAGHHEVSVSQEAYTDMMVMMLSATFLGMCS